MIPGMGAVATTFVAGVEAVRKGIAHPIGSLTQMGTIRLGKRTDGRSPKIKDFVPLAGLRRSGLHRLGYFEDNMYAAAATPESSSATCSTSQRPPQRHHSHEGRLRSRIRQENQRAERKEGQRTRLDLGEQLRQDIRDFKKSSRCQPLSHHLVARSTESFIKPKPIHQTVKSLEKAMYKNDKKHFRPR